jgi:hypothetical protein
MNDRYKDECKVVKSSNNNIQMCRQGDAQHTEICEEDDAQHNNNNNEGNPNSMKL